MLRFVLRKIRAKKWMMLCLLIGNILLTSIAAVNPMYTRAVLQKTLLGELKTVLTQEGVYPGGVTITAGMVRQKGVVRNQASFYAAQSEAKGLPQKMGVPAREMVEQISVANVQLTSRALREDDKEGKRVNVGFLSNIEDKIDLIAGEAMGKEVVNGVVDVIVSEKALVNLNLLLGETLDTIGLEDLNGNPVAVRIAGVYQANAMQDPYWVTPPSGYSTTLMMDEELFNSLFVAEDTSGQLHDLRGTWNVLMDYTQMNSDHVQHYVDVMAQLRSDYPTSMNITIKNNFVPTMESFAEAAKRVQVTLLVLQAPIFALLAVFIFMVSRQMVEMEESEIAVLKSRGAGKMQILTIYLIQSILLAGIGLALGLPLSVFLCQVLGSANAFLEFVSRTALPARIDSNVILYAAAAAVLSVLTMLIPVIKFSKVSIVSQKRAKRSGRGMPWWQKMGLDIIMLGVSVYGWYNFNAQKEVLYQRVLEGQSLDPLMFLSASLFIIGAGLVLLRILPLIVHLIYLIGKKWWSPAMFASFLQVIRTKGSQGFIMVFLMFTIALGLFNSTAARTIGDNAERNMRYSIGADIVVKEAWKDNRASTSSGPSSAQESSAGKTETRYYEPDYEGYLMLEDAQSVTRVLNDKAVTVTVSTGSLKNVRLMGINTKEFGQTAWFDETLLPTHWYHYLNAISQNANAVLVSENFETDYGFRLGDTISYRTNGGDTIRGVIYGFVPYFPTYNAVENVRGSDGVFRETDSYLIVAHLSTIQAAWGITPYEVWINVKDGRSSQFIYDYLTGTGKAVRTFRDTQAELINQKNDPVLQGTNGILTVGFIVVLVLCTVGFLIYWILSIRQRALQMGIFRAMGMTMREIIVMLINEQVWISGLSILSGVGIGWAASELFVPIIQIAYANSDQMVPLRVVMSAQDNAQLLIIVGIVMAICLCILGGIVSRMKIVKALKLGED